MKRWIALLLAVLLLPVQALAGVNLDGAKLPNDELCVELNDSGNIEDAMDAYAKNHFQSFGGYSESMLADSTMGFRMLVEAWEGKDEDPNYILRFLLELGYAEGENDGDWSLEKNKIALYIKQLLILAEMENGGFESVKRLSSEYMPQRDYWQDAIEYGKKLALYCVGRALDEAKNVLKKNWFDEMLSINRSNYASETLYKDMLANVLLSRVQADRLSMSKTLGATSIIMAINDVTKGLDNVTKDARLIRVTDAYERAMSGLRMLQALAPSEADDPYYYDACCILCQSYDQYLAELSELSADESAGTKLGNETYLDNRFDAILKGKITASGMDSVLVIASSVFKGVADLLSGGFATVAFDGLLNGGEMLLATKSTYAHMHSMSALNEIFDELRKSNASNPLESWEDHYAYAENVKRLCCVAMLGERHMYEISVTDAGLFVKLCNWLAEKLGLESDMEQAEKWYNLRVQRLQSLYERTEEFMAGLLQHYTELSAARADMTPYLGHEDESRGVICGEVDQAAWFAKTDGSGEPDLDEPNPDAGLPAEKLRVYLLADGKPIAETTTDSSGKFRIEYERVMAEGRKLTLQLSEKNNGKFAVRVLDAGSYANVTFPASFGWNADEPETLSSAVWSASVQVPYGDQMLICGPGKSYSQEMALASLGLAAASMSRSTADGTTSGSSGRDANIRSALSQMGFTVVQTSHYDTNLNDSQDGVPFAIGTKQVEETILGQKEKKLHRIVVLAVGGDVDAPAMARGLNVSLRRKAVDEMAASVNRCLRNVWDQSNEELHLWLTGFSWGGTIASEVSNKLNATSDRAVYTFGAPEVSGGGYHLAYEQDLLARGLISQNASQMVFSNLPDSDETMNVLSSVFYQLTQGNAPYSPRWYTADPLLRTKLKEIKTSEAEINNLLGGILTWLFVNSADGTDFRMQEVEERNVAVRSLLGRDADWTEPLMDVYAAQLMEYTDLPVFKTMPEEFTSAYQRILADVIMLCAVQANDPSFSFSNNLAASVLPVLLMAEEVLHSPTHTMSIAFAHHPEMYLAWLLGTDAGKLVGKTEPETYHVEVLPLPINLKGTVLDKETREPLRGVKVAIIGDDVTQVHTTDENGYWETYVDPAYFELEFTLQDYKPEKDSVSSSDFGEEAIELETLMEKRDLPALTAKLGDFTHYEDGVLYEYPEMKMVYAQEMETGEIVHSVRLKLTEGTYKVGRYTQSCYDSLTVEIDGLEPFTIALADVMHHSNGMTISDYIWGVFFTAVDMGDETYTCLLEFSSDRPVTYDTVLVLRTEEERLVPALVFDLLGKTKNVYGADSSRATMIDYTQTEPASGSDYGIFRYEGKFELREDGAYDMIIRVIEEEYGSGWLTYYEDSRYTLIEDKLVLVEQTLDPAN